MSEKIALLAGASGLVGSKLLTLLLDCHEYGKIIVVARSALDITHPKLEAHIVDFDNLASIGSILQAHDVFCCLGTTIKKAGSRENFNKVDHDYPLVLGKITASGITKQFLIVTSLGADKHSRIFYNRVKGEVEAAIAELSFESIHIFRPSILLGKREENRMAERVAQFLVRMFDPFMIGPLNKYRGVKAESVANGMLAMALAGDKGLNFYENDQILAF